MSGHNKWAQIKHKKAITDAKKGKVFSRFAKAISIAARDNPDPSTNARLKNEIDRARSQNMPNDNIERAIKRVSDKNAAALTEVTLELIGPGSSAIIVTAITDNSNRTINEIKLLASRMGGHMAGQGSVGWMFYRAGIIRVEKAKDIDALQLAAIDAGAEDVRIEDDSVVITTKPESFESIKSRLINEGEVSGEIEYIPSTSVPLSDEHQQKQLETLLDTLDEQDDVQGVYTNADY